MLLATDGEDVHEARMAARPEHFKRLETLKSEGRLLTAGQTCCRTIPNVFRAA